MRGEMQESHKRHVGSVHQSSPPLTFPFAFTGACTRFSLPSAFRVSSFCYTQKRTKLRFQKKNRRGFNEYVKTRVKQEEEEEEKKDNPQKLIPFPRHEINEHFQRCFENKRKQRKSIFSMLNDFIQTYRIYTASYNTLLVQVHSLLLSSLPQPALSM